MQYANLVTAVSSVLIAVKVGAYNWWWVALAAVCLVVLAIVDPKVYRGEHNYANRNNEEWQETRKQIKELHEKLSRNV